MRNSETKLIPFAKIFEISAIHIFDDPSLVEFIPDVNNTIASPENMRKKSQEAAIQLSLLHSKHAEIMKALATETDSEAREDLECRRDGFQAEIRATLEKWMSEGQLLDYEMRFEKRSRASIVFERLLNACAEEKIALFLNSETKLPSAILSRGSGARFLPKESILEYKIDGEIRSGIVCGDANEVREWLIGEDIVAGVFDTPEKRKRKCTALYEARLNAPQTCKCSKEGHFIAIKAVVPGLLKAEFESVRRALAVKIPSLTAPGRRPKPRPEA